MKSIGFLLAKERKDRHKITALLFLYAAFFALLGWTLIDAFPPKATDFDKFCIRRHTMVLIWMLVLLLRNKSAALVVLIACQMLAMGYGARAMLLDVSFSLSSFGMFAAFLLRGILKTSASMYLALANFSNMFVGRTLYGWLLFVQNYLFCVGVSFAADLLYNTIRPLY